MHGGWRRQRGPVAAATVRFADPWKPTVLLVTRPDCSTCNRNMPNWQKLVAATADRYRFVVLWRSGSNAGMASYLSGNHLSVLALALPPMDEASLPLRAGGTPQTIVVGPDGVVRKYWQGAFTHSIRAEVEEYFGVSLPVEEPLPSP
jgi:hypothetical protein